eukprot:3367995-Alexandrium_andersonii.AAC.1
MLPSFGLQCSRAGGRSSRASMAELPRLARMPPSPGLHSSRTWSAGLPSRERRAPEVGFRNPDL